MFTDAEFIVVSPHTVSAKVAIFMSLDGAGAGRLLVTLTIRVSPGLTCSVGDSWPSGVVKQYSVSPFASVAVLYARFTVSVPFWLTRSSASCTTLPGALRTHRLVGAALAVRPLGRKRSIRPAMMLRQRREDSMSRILIS